MLRGATGGGGGGGGAKSCFLPLNLSNCLLIPVYHSSALLIAQLKDSFVQISRYRLGYSNEGHHHAYAWWSRISDVLNC